MISIFECNEYISGIVELDLYKISFIGNYTNIYIAE